jgi:hypothetical protein
MTRRLLLLLGVALLCLPVLAAFLWRASSGLLPYSPDLERLQRENARGRELEVSLSATNYRLGTKQQVVQALLDGRMTAAEGIRSFRELNRGRPALPSADGAPPNLSEDEAACREILALAAGFLLGNRLDESGTALAQLERAFQEYLADGPGRHGRGCCMADPTLNRE